MSQKKVSKLSSPRKRKTKTFEIEFYEGLIERCPEFINVLISLGDAYTRKGFYQEGLAIDRRLALLKSEDPIVYYNLACSLSLLGKIDESLEALKRSVVLGYDDVIFMHDDADLNNVRQHPDYAAFYEKVKRGMKSGYLLRC